MTSTYHKGTATDVVNGYPVIQVTAGGAYSVAAVCESEARAIQVANLLTADEA